MAITVQMLKTLRADIDAALKKIGADHGVVVTSGRCTYSPNTATFKVEVATVADDGNAMTKEAVEFQSWASIWGLDAGLLFKTVTLNGMEYKVIGASRRRKKPITIQSVTTGKQYCTTVESLKSK